MRHESGLASLDQSIKPSGNTRQQVISGDVDDNGGGDNGDDGGWAVDSDGNGNDDGGGD